MACEKHEELPRSFQSAASEWNGRCQRLQADRSLVLDVLEQARAVPSFPVERWFNLEPLVRARQASPQRISWVTLFAKAYALAACDIAELRQFYLSFPWARFFQSRYSVISIAVNREIKGRDRLFFGRLRWPEDRTLVEIQQELTDYVEKPVEEMFRQQLLSAKMPRLLRRLGWWWRTNVRPSQRARRLGTGSMSVLAGQGVLNRQHPCVLTSSLSYGPIQEDGRLWVTLQCDHRLIDGVTAARALNLIESYLLGEVLAELGKLEQSRAA